MSKGSLLTLLGICVLVAASSRSAPETPSMPSPQDTAPPVLPNGTLGHTGLPAGLFWGLPMPTIWKIDNAYYAGDRLSLSRIATEVAAITGFKGLSELLKNDAKNIGNRSRKA